jgi:hypothetical protein
MYIYKNEIWPHPSGTGRDIVIKQIVWWPTLGSSNPTPFGWKPWGNEQES